ncbi:MAG: helix-turn-helix transcriptional regulator [Burkholderiales bacterium]
MGGIDLFLVAGAYGQDRIAHTGHLSGRRMQRAAEYVRLHLSENFRLEDMAAAAGLSAFHFARMFKKTTGLTPHRYLMNMRLDKAKALLRECERSLTEIAAECGFWDQSHMSRVFKRLAGVSPVEYRDGSRPREESPAVNSLLPASVAPLPGEQGGVLA